jgi:hypothetical protein
MQSPFYGKTAEFDDEFPPEETRNIPLFGFVTGSVISLFLWVAIAWIVAVLLHITGAL